MRAAAAALLAAAAVAPAAASAAAGPPSLRYATTPKFVVKGVNFKAGEHITVIVSSGGLHVGHAIASDGVFSAYLGPLKVAKCMPLRITAVGNRGSRAVLSTPAPLCSMAPPPGMPDIGDNR
jgi:hypothetical protein